MLDKIPVSKIAASSNFSKQYISQVKNGQRPVSQKLLDCLAGFQRPKNPDKNYFKLFMQSRLAADLSPNTIRFYESILTRFFQDVDADKAKHNDVEKFLLPFKNPGNRARYYQVIKTFYLWRESISNLPNPICHMHGPKVGRLILPSLTQDQRGLIDNGECFTQPMLEELTRIVRGLHGMKPEYLYKSSVDNA